MTKLTLAISLALAIAGAAGSTSCARDASNPAAVKDAVVLDAEAQAYSSYLDVILNRPWSKASLSAAEVSSIHAFVSSHPVASLDQLAKYDPTGAIGFCFGRSTAVTLSARVLGLDPTEVRQLFVVGDLRSTANPEWRFHVTTLVRSDDSWVAVDPIMPGPLPMQEWVDRVSRTWDKGGKATFYMTPFDTILPDLTAVPDTTKETGSNLIEISFSADARPGFTKVGAGGKALYEVTRAAAQTYFMTSTETARFKFDKIAINGADYDYLGYFSDLLVDLKPRTDLSAGVVPAAATIKASSLPGTAVSKPLGLNFEKLKK